MPNPFGAPELTVQEVEQKRRADDNFVWLDIREPSEHDRVRIEDDRIELLPLSRLAEGQMKALPARLADKETTVVVMCHFGLRSARVVMWLQQHGWEHAYNLGGGIEAWAQGIDPSIGTY